MEDTYINNNLELKEKIFESDGGTNVIHNAIYYGVPCYAVVHVPTEHTEIIDHDESIVKAIINRIKRSSALVCDKKATGYILKFHPTKTERRITLRHYVYAKYNKIQLNNMRGKNIFLDDNSAVKDNILDLRSINIYDAGAIREHTSSRDISIIERQGSGEKYIAISFPNRENGKIECNEYIPQLYEMLARPSYCEIGYNKEGDRATVVVHYTNNRKGYVEDNLSRFISIYKLEFDKYIKMSGGVKRFIHNYYRLSREKYKGKEAAHINACKWNNCFNNLLFMDATDGKNPNLEMSDYIKWFSSPYEVYTAVNNNGEILIEIGADLLKNGEPIERYYKCPTPEDYADWQKVLLGKTLTGKLQVATYATKDGVQQELTPCGMIKAGEIDRETVKNNEPDLWRWLEHRDSLLSMDDNSFHVWRAGAGRTVIPVTENIGLYGKYFATFTKIGEKSLHDCSCSNQY